MNKRVLPLHKTGWFYLLLFVLLAMLGFIDDGGLKSANQWNREVLYKVLPNSLTTSQLSASGFIRLRVSDDELNDFQTIQRLMSRFPQAVFAFMTGFDEVFASKLKDYLQENERQGAVILATENDASAVGFSSGAVKLGTVSRLYKNIHSIEPVQWTADVNVIHAPLILENDGGLSLLWQNKQQIYPSFITHAFGASQLLPKFFGYVSGLDQHLVSTGKYWPVGIDGRVYAAGEIPKITNLTEFNLAEMEKRSSETTGSGAAKLFLVEDGGFSQANETARLLYRMQQQNYLYQGWLVKILPFFLVIIGFLASWWLVKQTVGKQVVFYLIYLVILLICQYVAFSQKQWLPILPVLLFIVPTWMMFTGYRKEAGRFEELQRNHNSLLADAIPAFYQTQQFEKLQPLLEKTSPDLPLLNSVFDVSLQAEAKNNFTLAKKLLEWIRQTGIKHEGSRQKLDELQVYSEQGALDSTLVISPGQENAGTLFNPVYQIDNFGRYQIEGVLGKGAMGIVFQGVDPKINRHVAIKTLQLNGHVEEQNLDEMKARFFREAETAGNLSHANIVTIYDVGEEGELGYIAMDLLTGAPLSKFLKPDTRLPAPLVYQLMIQITDALDYAHRQNVVHRDIKPANIIYDDEIQRVTLTDFGIACVADKSKTSTGTIMGSPYYMSPEQVLGQRVDGRSDIFSLGVSFYQLLSGHLPFDGESIASVAFHITKTRHEPVRKWDSKLPTSAARITNKAMQKDVAKRYQTMQEFKQALINALKRDFKRAPIL